MNRLFPKEKTQEQAILNKAFANTATRCLPTQDVHECRTQRQDDPEAKVKRMILSPTKINYGF
jgi:hypothetical protein